MLGITCIQRSGVGDVKARYEKLPYFVTDEICLISSASKVEEIVETEAEAKDADVKNPPKVCA